LPQNETKTTGHSWYQDLYQDKSRLTEFMFAMAGYQSENFKALTEIFDFSPYSVFCDVGGATGSLAIRIAERYPNMRCKTFDLAVVEPIAQATIRKAGLQDRIEAISGDFVAGPLPEADVICLGNIMHNWNVATRKMLIAKAFAALPVGGALLGMEHFIDDDRRTELDSMLMSLNMLIETQSGSEMTRSEFDGYCREAGFQRVEYRHVSGGTSVGIAWK
jgi:cyclopropane fatty-acyl-phospholipid synthase-like methyltransferase